MKTSRLQVMHSNAGYYIGVGYREDDMPASLGYPLPYSRESGYYATQEQAQAVLDAFYEDNPDLTQE